MVKHPFKYHADIAMWEKEPLCLLDITSSGFIFSGWLCWSEGIFALVKRRMRLLVFCGVTA